MCRTLQPFNGGALHFCRGTEISPGMSPGEKPLQEGSLWCWVRHGPVGKHREQDLSWVGAWGRMVAPQEQGNPALLASSEQLALTDNSSGAGRQSMIPSSALPLPSRATEQLSGIFPTCTFPLFGYLYVSLPALSSGTASFGPRHRNLGNKSLSLGICRVRCSPDPLQKHKVISCWCWSGWQCSRLL